jgi:hypothetical protein
MISTLFPDPFTPLEPTPSKTIRVGVGGDVGVWGSGDLPADTAVLFNRGDTHYINPINAAGNNSKIGFWGPANDPPTLINAYVGKDPSSMIRHVGKGCVIEGVRFVAGQQQWMNAVAANGTDLTVRNCIFDKTLRNGVQVAEGSPAVRTTLVNNQAPDGVQWYTFYVNGGATDTVIANNVSTQTIGQHIWREDDSGGGPAGPLRLWVLFNNFSASSDLDGKLVSVCNARSGNGIFIYGNTLTGRDPGSCGFGIGPQEVVANQTLQNVVFENNRLVNIREVLLFWGTKGLKWRNNTFDKTKMPESRKPLDSGLGTKTAAEGEIDIPLAQIAGDTSNLRYVPATPSPANDPVLAYRAEALKRLQPFLDWINAKPTGSN